MLKKIYASFRRLLSKLIPEYTITPMVSALLFQVAVYSGTRPFTQNLHHYNFESALDLAIPFLPWTVSIYVGAFVFWYISYVLIMNSGKENAFRFLCAHVISLIVIFFCFVLLPTTNTRPEVTGHSIWDYGMRIIYATDAPNNLFPSLHCQTSWLCSRGLKKAKVPRWFKRFAYVFTVLIFISTLTTKQHILMDVFGGWLLAEITFDLCASKKITRPFYRIFDRENANV